MPDIMARAGAKLVEVGTTNRTHLKDYAAAIGRRPASDPQGATPRTTASGFTKAVPAAELAPLAREHGVP